MQRLATFLAFLFLAACGSRQLTPDPGLALLTSWMSGTFSSHEQAARDTAFFDINLVMYPIWKKDVNARWLYVEQDATAALDRPYRQRIYRISRVADGSLESRVYELPDPAAFIHAWEDPAIFRKLQPEALLLREGCAVYLRPAEDGQAFSGATHARDCPSELYGAAYATSEVTITAETIVSWDRGWDQNDQQVWGAEKAGYVFKRISEAPATGQ
jgi:hypothetical protein